LLDVMLNWMIDGRGDGVSELMVSGAAETGSDDDEGKHTHTHTRLISTANTTTSWSANDKHRRPASE